MAYMHRSEETDLTVQLSRGDLLIAELAAAMMPNPRPCNSGRREVTIKKFPAAGLFCPTCIEGSVCAFHSPTFARDAACSTQPMACAGETSRCPPCAWQVTPRVSHFFDASQQIEMTATPCIECWLNGGSCPIHDCLQVLQCHSAHPSGQEAVSSTLKDDEEASTDIVSSDQSYAGSECSEPTISFAKSQFPQLRPSLDAKQIVWARGSEWGMAARTRAR